MARPPPDPEFVLRGSIDTVNTVQFYSPLNTSQDFLLSGCASGEVRVWNLSNRRSEIILNGHHSQGILQVHVLGGNSILSHGRDNQILVWDIGESRNDVTESVEVASMSLCQCAVISKDDGNHLLAVPGLENSEVKVHHLESKTMLHRLIPPTGHKALGMPMSLKFIDSRQLLIGYEDGSILQWSLETSQIMAEKTFHSEPVMCLDYSATCGKGISGSADEKLVTWNLEKDALQTSSEMQLTNPGVSDVCIRHDDKICATAGWDARIRVFGLKKLKPLVILSHHTETIHCLDFSQPLQQFQSQCFLAAGSKDKHISVWSVYNNT